MIAEEWHKWRDQGIGSSDAPIVCGVSPYMTPFQLWELKTGRRKRGDGNWATRQGQAMEPRARATYELMYDCDMPPRLVVHPNFQFLRASLDGYNDVTRTVLEIKCPGRDDHLLALNGQIPEKYYPQVQHQIFVSRALVCHYWSYYRGRGTCVPVYLNEAWIKEYFPKAMDFWECVESDTPPPLVAGDWRPVRSKDLRQALEEWWRATDVEHADYLSRQIISTFGFEDKRIRCAGFRVDGYAQRITLDDAS